MEESNISDKSIFWKTFKIAFVLLSILIFLSPCLADTISSCQDINGSGNEVYELTTNLTGSSSGSCIRIFANNTVLDCNGHTIDGNGSEWNGIMASSVVNITIRNCIVVGYYGYNDSGGFGGLESI